jgi:xanthine/CO dehydrogenase XdhC/CoxF family maturation factor
VIAGPWEAAVGQIRFTANTAVVLMTHSLPDDAILLPLLADKPFAYAGVLGPAHRREALVKIASEAGSMNDDVLTRLRGPIGLDLGDRSAGGIAVAVISEIMAQLNDRDGRAMSRPPPPARLLSLSPAHA